MADVTYYVALPFVMSDQGLAPREGVDTSAEAAIMRAAALSRKDGNIGALAFSRTRDPSLGEFADAVLLRAFGDVLSDLSGL